MAIRAYHARELAEHMKARPAWVDYDLVFTTKLGEAHRATPLRARFRTVLNQASVPAIHYHDLRHACATMLAEE